MKKLISTLLFFIPLLLSAQCNNGEDLIINGSFETGDFSNWNTQECLLAFPVQDVVDDSFIFPIAGFSGMDNIPDGTYAAYNSFEGIGFCESSLCQTVNVPSQASSAILEWYEIVEWDATLGATEDKTHEVNIINSSTGNTLQTIHSITINPNTILVNVIANSGWSNYQFDLVAYAGQTIDICFTEVVQEPALNGAALVYYDDISLTISCTQTPTVESVPTLSEWGLIFMSILLMTVGTLKIASTTFAGIGNLNIQVEVSSYKLPFNKRSYTQAMILTVLLTCLGFVSSMILTGDIAFSDWIGTTITAPLFAYFVHLIIILTKE